MASAASILIRYPFDPFDAEDLNVLSSPEFQSDQWKWIDGLTMKIAVASQDEVVIQCILRRIAAFLYLDMPLLAYGDIDIVLRFFRDHKDSITMKYLSVLVALKVSELTSEYIVDHVFYTLGLHESMGGIENFML